MEYTCLMSWNEMYLPLPLDLIATLGEKYETGYLTQVTARAVVTLGTEFDKGHDKITSGWD